MSSTRNNGRSLMRKICNLYIVPLCIIKNPPSHLLLPFLELSQPKVFHSLETALKTKDYAVKHVVSTFNTQIYLSWIQMFSHTQSLLSLLDQTPSPLSTLKSTWVVTPDHFLFCLPPWTPIYTERTAEGWISLKLSSQMVLSLSLGSILIWMTLGKWHKMAKPQFLHL